MFVYLAQPIDQANETKGIDNILEVFDAQSVGCYRPARAFHLPPSALRGHLAGIDRINYQALRVADALVAWLPPGVPTLGTPSEIETALAMDKPTLILTDHSLMRKSVQLLNWENRGATVVDWRHSVQSDFLASPTRLLQMLNRRPSNFRRVVETTTFDSEERTFLPADPAAKHTNKHDLICANHGDCDAPHKRPPLGVLTPDLTVHLADGAIKPRRAHHDDAGLDLAILNNETLEAGECRMLPTGIRAALPDGYWGLITGRSSTWVKHGCDVRQGVIDAGYRGELMVQLHNQNTFPVHFLAGTRLAQYVLLPAFPGAVRTVPDADHLPEHARGLNGYGSSGA
jgi:dUTP pyrophosphatase